MTRPYCIEFKPRTSGTNKLTWYGYTYRDAENRDAHARLFQTGAEVKIRHETGSLWGKQFHLIVGMP